MVVWVSVIKHEFDYDSSSPVTGGISQCANIDWQLFSIESVFVL